MTISIFSIITISIALCCGFLIPFGMGFYLNKKKSGKISVFFIGCATFFVFAMILETIPKFLIFTGKAGNFIMQKAWLYSLIGAALAGIFEETGRFVASKIILCKKCQEKLAMTEGQIDDNQSLMLGAGHGGFEAFYILVSGMAMNLYFAIAIKTGSINGMMARMDSSNLGQMQAMIFQLMMSKPYVFLIAVLERLIAVVLHISLSVLVWFSAKGKKFWYLYPVAILLHILVDFCSSYAMMSGLQFWWIELIVFSFDALLVTAVWYIWKFKKILQ